ncbi:fumarylacetoacetate hydrolase family protein [Oceanomicrobium pacificus]|uniref:2-keto-4-pentenoate hydratase n=1 Tax=Oceanomicrobium pacificus TaxID=2692916 RepID=A0A6B0TXS3_9RHOB|nr:fumarylacetoacetate hydrolase family protein [Oceanomicrobium pacificus]MXU66505.1 hypothetical protein [Oceanomicrobium pacificus]
MKLATLDDGSRDGRLVCVSRNLAWCTGVGHIAPTLQAALDAWDDVAPKLEAVAAGVESGSQPLERFHERLARAPLPRAYQWADGSAYVNHVALVRRARGAEMPERFWTDPLLYQGGSDGFLGPRDPIPQPEPDCDLDCEGEIAVITGDVPMGCSAEDARGLIRLVMLCNDVSLRALIPDELAKGFGFFQSKPASAFSPVAVTPDALGAAWRDGRLHLPLHVDLNDAPLGRAEAGEDMIFDFGTLIAHAARTRALGAGTIIGSGTVSNTGPGGADDPGLPLAEGGRGYSCIAEQRVVELLRHGAASTPFLATGDRVRIEMKDADGQSIFGAIEQEVVAAGT